MVDGLKKILILSDYGSVELAEKVHYFLENNKILNLEPFNPFDIYINRFAAKEIDIELKRSVREQYVFLFKSFNVYPELWNEDLQNRPNLENLIYQPTEGYVELFEINDALRRGAAKDIINILPHMPYQRQDRRPKRKGKFCRTPVSAKLFAEFISISGCDRVITLDPHFKQIEGFYNIGFDSLSSFVLFAEYIESNLSHILNKTVFVAPDYGSSERTSEYSNFFNRPLAIFRKSRNKPGESKTGELISDIDDFQGMYAMIMDDMVDGGGTLINTAQALRERKVSDVYCFCTHPVLSNNAKDKLLQENLKLITTNTIRINDLNHYPNIKVLDVSFPIAKAIECTCKGKSMDENLSNYKTYIENKKASTLS